MFQRKPTQAELAEADSAERLAKVLTDMETQPALGFRITPLAVRQGFEPAEPVVMVRLGVNRHRLTPAEARTIGRCVEWDCPTRRAGLLASLFHSAASDAEAMADRQLAVVDGGRVVEQGDAA